MKHSGKRLSGLLAILLWLCTFTPTVWGVGMPEIKSEAYLVLDAQTGQILIEKNAHQRMYPASITKILTCALALQHSTPGATTTLQ
ncbi:MAG: D-alanyl-D-alanine carboxypeptidase, partial [Oscillospiraceae bacterium]